MSKSSKSKSALDREMEGNIAQFCGVTGASVKDAKKFLERFKRVDVAIDAYYNDPAAVAATAKQNAQSGPSTTKLNQLFDQYKDTDGDDIAIDGTIKLCEDLATDPEDVVLLAVAYELKSPGVGQWSRNGWVEGWKGLGCDNIPAMKTSLMKLRDKLGSDPAYFQKVYIQTFEFAKSEGQRSLPLEMAQAFWALLLPAGLRGGALSHIIPPAEDGEDQVMAGIGEGWKDEYTDMWFEFLAEKKVKGVSKDTWTMLLDFIRTIDVKFEKHDMEAAWPSTIDDFVEWMQVKLRK